ncbi:DUF2802 domain-containing protein [Halorhodospira halochloris]|uniref:DUF2802 domain-containing protein n=1 Tax=Halorhodospira halochloris TaxID=1052 RepID=UPI001EE83D57|nr:DUF2802 domain-containing protein [Halorhodospira halochloris]MCG5530490.1 DUF2802 domain-containing protein [Halorhodospira halochloris]
MDTLTAVALVVAVAAAGVAAVAAWHALGLTGRIKRAEKRMEGLEATTQQILEHFQGLSAGAVGQGEHLARLEQNLARLRRRLDQVAAAGGSDGGRFNQAIRMARKGAAAQEIAETCQISQVEADLVVLLHSPSSGEK